MASISLAKLIAVKVTGVWGNHTSRPPRAMVVRALLWNAMRMKSDVLIVGAGPVGLCLSLALAARGMRVDVIDRQSSEALAAPVFDGREIALTHRSIRLLRELGVWNHIPGDGHAPLRRARVMDGFDPGFEVDCAAYDRDRLGELVSNHYIRAAAWQAAAANPLIRVRAAAALEIVDRDPRAVRVRLVDGRILETTLLVGADSRFSETRRAMGVPVYMHDCGLSMLLCRMRHSIPNNGTAWEWFGHGQTRALLPLEEHLSSMILTVPGVQVQYLLDLPPKVFATEIAARYEGRLGDVELASTRHTYPLVTTWARRFVDMRFALAGDAAVGMHPVTAHGFNLGLASVEHLTQAATDGLRRYGDPGDAKMLARYQRRHRVGAIPLFAGTQAVAGLFTDERLPVRPLRRNILRVYRALPVLRRALAASLADETPRPLSPVRHARLGMRILWPRLGYV